VDPDGRKIFPGQLTNAWQSIKSTSIGKSVNSRFNNFFKDILMGGIDVSFNIGTPSGIMGLCSSRYETNLTQSGLSLIAVSLLKNININVKSGLDSFQQSLVLAHELGHALNVQATIVGTVQPRSLSQWRSAELAGFKAQFNTASELYNFAAGPYSENAWENALKTTLPAELQDAFSKYDISKSFNQQSNEFNSSFKSGIDQYVQRTYSSGEFN
jgi:hypothetical protein